MKILGNIWKLFRLPSKLQLFIMRFLHDEFLIGVTGIFFDDKKRVLLVKHTYRDGWSLPGGYIKGKEHPKEGLEREIEEESNLIVSVDGQLNLRTDRNNARIDITYYGTYLGGQFKKSNEVKRVKLFPFSRLPKIPKDQLLFIDKAKKMMSDKE